MAHWNRCWGLLIVPLCGLLMLQTACTPSEKAAEPAATAGPQAQAGAAQAAGEAPEPVAASTGEPAAASAEPAIQVGGVAPPIQAVDIRGNQVDLYGMIEKGYDFVVVYFFSIATGEEAAVRLDMLKQLYQDKVDVVALGLQEDEDALRDFATKLGIDYYLIPDRPGLDTKETYGPIRRLPLTLFVDGYKADKTILRILRGGGAQRDLFTVIADLYNQTQRPDDARQVASEAIEQGEDETKARAVIGLSYLQEGAYEEAEQELSEIQSHAYLAKSALEQGDYSKAVSLAEQAPENQPYARTVMGYALMNMGDLERAEQFLSRELPEDAAEWQRSEALNGLGRVRHARGNVDEALAQYAKASQFNVYNADAWSNEGAAYRDRGEPERAREVLERASSIVENDKLIAMMLSQVTRELERQNDQAERERIRQRIQDLGERYRELQEQGMAEPVDTWSSRPMVVAFLPSESDTPYFFERAGTDVALRREIEIELQQNDRIQVVERELLDQLLQELDLGSSELAGKDTQLRLGQVLAARMLGYIDFASQAGQNKMYLRLIDTETTAIAGQYTLPVAGSAELDALVQQAVQHVSDTVRSEPLKGLIAQVNDDGTVVINLGGVHGLKAGDQFRVIVEGEAMEVSGRTVPGKREVAGTLEVSEVYDDMASTCTVVDTSDGVTLEKEMKILQAPAATASAA